MKAAHAIARMLCRQKHGDWRYDPGDEAFDGFYEDALVLLEVALPYLPEYMAEAAA